jgi:hypothetical protein
MSPLGSPVSADLHRDFGGFVIASNGRTIFHCGDTAYFPGFKEIGDRFSVDWRCFPLAPMKRLQAVKFT